MWDTLPDICTFGPQCLHKVYMVPIYHYRLSFWTLTCSAILQIIYICDGIQLVRNITLGRTSFYKRHIIQDNSKNKGEKRLAYRKSLYGHFGESVCVNLNHPQNVALFPGTMSNIPERACCCCRPWDSPGKNTGVGCHFLLQSVKVKLLSRVRLLATPWIITHQAPPPMGILQARVLEWGAIAFSASSVESWSNRTGVLIRRGRDTGALFVCTHWGRPRGHAARRQSSASQGEGSRQNPILLAPTSQTCSLPNYKKINPCLTDSACSILLWQL